MRTLAVIAASLLVACAGEPGTSAPAPDRGPVAQSVTAAAAETGVPRDLLLAVGVIEGGVKLAPHRLPDADDHVPVAGVLELRHGRLDTLALGAQLAGTTEDALRADTVLGTRAGALVLAQLGAETGARTDDLASWRTAVEQLSGLRGDDADRYADDVYALLRTGGERAGYGGEVIVILPHADLPEPAVRADRFSIETPEFPGAEWFDTSCSNKCTPGRPDGLDSVRYIVIHDTEGGWNASVATLQNDGGKSVQYIIDADGSRVGQFLHESDTAWHAGNYDYNKHSIGIEHVGVASDPAGYQTGLYDKSVELVQSIRTRWDVPLDRAHIIGHYQIPNGNNIAEGSPACADHLSVCEESPNYGGAGRHTDPGYNWQWCQYMQKLGGACTCNDAWENFNCTTDLTEAVRCQNGTVEIVACTAGCVVMPVGTPDQCNVAPPDTGGEPDAGPTVDPGQPDASPDRPGDTPDDDGMFHLSGGCTTATGRGRTGGLATLLALLALAALATSARAIRLRTRASRSAE